MNQLYICKKGYPWGLLFILVILCSSFLPISHISKHVLIFLYALTIRSKYSYILWKDFEVFSIIFVLCILQVLIIWLAGRTTFVYLSRGFSTSLFSICEIFLCYKLIKGYGINAFVYLCDALMVIYSVNILVAIQQFGLQAVVDACFSIFSSGFETVNKLKTDSVLESAHSILLIMPLNAIMYYINYKQTFDKNILIRLIFAIVISLLAYKRIAIGAAIVVFVLKNFDKYYNKKTICLSAIIIASILFTFIWSIRSGYFYLFSSDNNLDLNYRDVLWPVFERFYDLNPNYIGQGWGFVSKYFQLNNHLIWGNNIGGLHNDILKIFIELGFYGFFIYIFYFLIYIPIYLYKKRDIRLSFIFWLCQLYLIFIYLTDNATIYPQCQYIAYLAPFYAYYHYNKSWKIKNRK